ncbi:hypothetical protein IJ541_08520 [bacterium]|nr:hypothetical protein [bacterium]
MATNNLNDGVGKKIVEALKMQSAEATDENFITEEEPEISVEQQEVVSNDSNDFFEENDSDFELSQPQEQTPVSDIQAKVQSQLQFQAAIQPQSNIDSAFNQSLAQNLGASYAQNDDFDYPSNVAVLKQLIAKLPAGVSKQTGALIIKQTMEALGISMGSVLQEAKQVQETLSANSKECQNNIVEYRKQIGILEAKSQNYQRQASVMNDIINLFIQTRG